MQQRSDVQRKNIKATIEISGVRGGRTTIEAKRDDRSLAGWPAAIALQLPAPWPASEYETVNFTQASAFRAADITVVTIYHRSCSRFRSRPATATNH